MPDGVSSLNRAASQRTSVDSGVQGQIGGHPVQKTRAAPQRHFTGRAGQKIANFFKAIGAAPQSLKQRIVNHKEARRAERAAAAANTPAGKRAALLNVLPAGLSISDEGVISGRVVGGAIATKGSLLTKDYAGKSLSEVTEMFANKTKKDATIGGERLKVSTRGYDDMGRLRNFVTGKYDSSQHVGKEQGDRSVLAADELHAQIGDAKQTANLIGILGQDMPRLFSMAFKNDRGEALGYRLDDGGKTEVPHSYRNPDGKVEQRVGASLSTAAYTLSNFRDGKVDVKMCYDASVVATIDADGKTIPLPGMDGSAILMKGEMNLTIDLTGDDLKVVGEPELTAVVEGHMAV